MLRSTERSAITPLFQEILKEYESDKWMKYSRLCSLSDLLYIDLTRLYSPAYQKKNINQGYLDKLTKLENLVEQNYKSVKFPKKYAALMNISEKHLNRICKACLNKTTTDIIADRVIVEAKRLLIISKFSISQVAEELGYIDNAYFSRLFKKKSHQTPLQFIQQYNS